MAREQLLSAGLTPKGVRHRLARGRLYELYPGVYAVGRPQLSCEGGWMAAVLHCGRGAVLSHLSAAQAWGILQPIAGPIHVSVSYKRSPSSDRIRIHRRSKLPEREITRRHGIPIASPALTLVDIAPRLSRRRLEAAVNEADKLDLIDPDSLRRRVEAMPRMPGKGLLRALLDWHALALTDSELERRFLRLLRAAGLPQPLTQQHVNGFRVDFFWPGLGLVVETDGLRYHRTPAQQAQDHARDQAHARDGLTTLRFTHAQVAYEQPRVAATLSRVIARLSSPA